MVIIFHGLIAGRINGVIESSRQTMQCGTKTNENAFLRSAEADLELSGVDASTFFDSMEASGIQPATVNGQVIYGSTTLNADAIHCTSSFDANFTKHCEITDGASGSELKLNDAAMAHKMVEVMERIGAKVNPLLIGANNYEVLEVSCTKPVVPNPEVSCSLKLVK